MFNISATGGLTPVPGLPFPDTGAAGIDCNCASTQLYVAVNGTTSKVDVFNIGLSGALSRIPGSPFTGPGANSNVAILGPDDSKLFVSDQGSNTVTVFSVAPDGSLTVVPGSPFPAPGALFPSGMATNQAGTFLYAADFNNLVNGFSIAPGGALTSVHGSPFSNGFPGNFGLLSLAVFPPKTCCPAPVITGASATPNVLWPPNHKFVEVTIDYTVTDPCPNTCVLTVASNEPPVDDKEPEWIVVDAHHVQLRAERLGSGDGASTPLPLPAPMIQTRNPRPRLGPYWCLTIRASKTAISAQTDPHGGCCVAERISLAGLQSCCFPPAPLRTAGKNTLAQSPWAPVVGRRQ